MEFLFEQEYVEDIACKDEVDQAILEGLASRRSMVTLGQFLYSGGACEGFFNLHAAQIKNQRQSFRVTTWLANASLR